MKVSLKNYLAIAALFIAGCDSCKNCHQKDVSMGGKVEAHAEHDAMSEHKKPAMVSIELSHMAPIVAVQKEIKPVIDQIIVEEYKQVFGDQVQHSIPTFKLKTNLGMSLYYLGVTDFSTDHLFSSMLSIMQGAGQGCEMLHDVYGSDSIEFFGADKNELVVKIDDQQQSVHKLHQSIKHAFRTLNSYVRDVSGKDIIDFAVAEKYAFVPHVTLGKIEYVNVATEDQEQMAIVRSAIQSKVLEVIRGHVESLKAVHIEAESFKLYNSMHKEVRSFSLKKM